MFFARLSYQIHLAFSDLEGINAAYTASFMVYGKHDTGSLSLLFLEILAQNIHDEVHGGEVVVDQHHPIHGWFFYPWFIHNGPGIVS